MSSLSWVPSCYLCAIGFLRCLPARWQTCTASLSHACVPPAHPPCTTQVVDEFLVLGSQPLTVLHDNLHCLAGAHLHAIGAEGSGAAYFYAEVQYVPLLHTVAYSVLACCVLLSFHAAYFHAEVQSMPAAGGMNHTC